METRLHIAHIRGEEALGGNLGAGLTFLDSHRKMPAEPPPQRNDKHLQLGMGLWEYRQSLGLMGRPDLKKHQ